MGWQSHLTGVQSRRNRMPVSRRSWWAAWGRRVRHRHLRKLQRETYIQLTEAEAAFRIHKSDLAIRPIWHHKQGRVKAHILI